MTIKGYSIVNLRDEEGRYTVGFRKAKSALDNWEAIRDELEGIADEALCQAIEDIGEVTWWDSFFWGIETSKGKLKLSCYANGLTKFIIDSESCTTIKEALMINGYLSSQEASFLSNSLKYVRYIDHYKAMAKLIKNGEQFYLSDQLCGFINEYSTYSPRGEK